MTEKKLESNREQSDTVTVARGLTVQEVARRYRVSPDKVRAWIRRGELAAINTSGTRCGKPRFVILPEALAAFENGHAAQTDTPKPQRRKVTPKGTRDYFPDWT